jgi:uncharacterized protein YdcH (DUF465 family)
MKKTGTLRDFEKLLNEYTTENARIVSMEYSEKQLIQKTLSNLKTKELSEKDANSPLILDSMSIQFIDDYVNLDNYSLTQKGEALFSEPNFHFFFSPFSRFETEPSIEIIDNIPLTPYDYYFFLLEFIENISYLSSDYQGRNRIEQYL